MKPATCFLCGRASIDEEPDTKGDWVKFADYSETAADTLSHPNGLEYVCGEHLAAAQGLAEETTQAALVELRTKFGDDFETSNAPVKTSKP